MVSILALCNLGMSASLLLKMKLEEMLFEEGICNVEVYVSDHCSVNPVHIDLIFASTEIGNSVRTGEIPKIIINNFLDKNELRDKGLTTIREISTGAGKYKTKISV